MAAGRTMGFAVLGLALGTAAGGGVGLLGGLAYTTLTATSGFEGYSGFVVGYWILAGSLFGLIAGLLVGLKVGRRS